jgi:hypothetical protein
MPVDTRFSELDALRLDDVALVRRIWDTIGELDDDQLADRLYVVTGECIERWSPDIEKAAHALEHDNDASEIAGHAEYIEERARKRAIYAKAHRRAANVPEPGDNGNSSTAPEVELGAEAFLLIGELMSSQARAERLDEIVGDLFTAAYGDEAAKKATDLYIVRSGGQTAEEIRKEDEDA